MRDYIKKFDSANAADNYAITATPFTCTVVSGGVANDVNLRCKVEGKKIAVNDGNVVIEDAGPSLITFYIANTQYQAEEGMTWEEFVNSEFNVENWGFEGGTIHRYTSDSDKWLYDENWNFCSEDALIIQNGIYNWGMYN